MHKSFSFLALLIFTSFVLAGVPDRSLSSGEEYRIAIWQDKVDPSVLAGANDHGESDFILFLVEQANLSAAESLRTKEEKGVFVYKSLRDVANRTQGPVLKTIKTLGAAYKPFWIANMIWVKGDSNVIEMMARRPDIAHIYANPSVHLDELPLSIGNLVPMDTSSVEWNIALVGAPQVWANGVTGEGAVIGGQDTGYDWDHPALIGKYRGWDGNTADHDYNWYDAIGGNVICPDPGVPCDDHGHGTHTMGTMVGDDGGTKQIGMAPGAKWIGCRNMDQGVGTYITYSDCFQWFVAPTDLNGASPDPSKAPHVINNSWSCPPSELGCDDPLVLQTVVDNTRSAGIVVVVSAGNSGSNCSTINTPAAIYASSFTVGSTTSSDTISSFSSRGPVTVDGSNRLKPDITAPGSLVRSSLPGGRYGDLSGTSMAGPHVAGLVGLLIATKPELAGQVDLLEDIIEQTAVPKTTFQNCGMVSGTEIPNNTYGWGRIDAFAAYSVAKLLGLNQYYFPAVFLNY